MTYNGGQHQRHSVLVGVGGTEQVLIGILLAA